MNLRALLPLALLSSALALSACGNKGPLLPPPAPEDDELPVGPAGRSDSEDLDDATLQEIEEGVDGEGDDPAPPVTGDDGDDDA